ncbi:pyridoxamine 5'-phosphate oxidase [Flavobacteriaceae bacterium R38]|nr:pyridoxamine 5'-phosphate oxidase [Flavobacteriaceae bacterium R38]
METIFHQGELEVQKLTGEGHIATMIAQGGMMKSYIPTGYQDFIESQTLVFVTSKDENNALWVSMVSGEAGIFSIKDSQLLNIHLHKLHTSQKDILFENIITNKEIGLICIDLSTRKRVRVNGIVSISGNILSIHVEQSYSNCPKYIQRRKPQETTLKKSNSVAFNLSGLTSEMKNWIQNADTFFVGSAYKNNFDTSHRGGLPGFIEILDDHSLKIPDYQGNSLFNTLGNFKANPNAGLLFIDFNQNNILQLSGKASLLFDQKEENDITRTGGTGRYWIFTIEKIIETQHHNSVEWEFIDNSPFNPKFN